MQFRGAGLGTLVQPVVFRLSRLSLRRGGIVTVGGGDRLFGAAGVPALRETVLDPLEMIDGFPDIRGASGMPVELGVKCAGHVQTGGRPGPIGRVPVNGLKLFDARHPGFAVFLGRRRVAQLFVTGLGPDIGITGGIGRCRGHKAKTPEKKDRDDRKSNGKDIFYHTLSRSAFREFAESVQTVQGFQGRQACDVDAVQHGQDGIFRTVK